MNFSARLATLEDVPRLTAVMDASISELQRGFLEDDQIEASRAVMGIDTQLIEDGTYFVIETPDGDIAGCGGWSRRATMYGNDHSPGRDYWGIDLAAVAEVTGTSRCNDYVDSARIGFRSTTPGATVVAEDPVSGRTQACATRRVTVGASWGGVSGSVAQDFTQCERIGVSGALQPAMTSRVVIFDNNGNCHAGDRPYDGRELGQVGVIEVPQGRGPGLVLTFGADAGNADTCKEDRC